jgi:2-oxoisovalerate dehydrogenase E1 component
MSRESSRATYNKLELLKLMYLSREGDRREGVLLRQGKGWFQVAGMGHESLAVIAMQLKPEDYLFPY